ncbi:hypothetical protein HYS54_02820 [Candidatus Micrarchaeota archaeon]|nr:hypothetical protein [Candidatus Micrarchaeota archaeon]
MEFADELFTILPYAVAVIALLLAITYGVSQYSAQRDFLSAHRGSLEMAELQLLPHMGVLNESQLDNLGCPRSGDFKIRIEAKDLERDKSWSCGDAGNYTASSTLPFLVRAANNSTFIGELTARVKLK